MVRPAALRRRLASCGKNSWLSAVFLPLWARLPSLRCSGLPESARRQARISCAHRLDSDDQCVVCRPADRSAVFRGSATASGHAFQNQSVWEVRPRRTSSSARRSRRPSRSRALTLFVNGFGRSRRLVLTGFAATSVATVSCPVRDDRPGGRSAKLVVRFFRLDRHDSGWKRFVRRGRKSTVLRRVQRQRQNDTANLSGLDHDRPERNRAGGLHRHSGRHRLWLAPPRRPRRPRSRRGRSVARSAVHSGRLPECDTDRDLTAGFVPMWLHGFPDDQRSVASRP